MNFCGFGLKGRRKGSQKRVAERVKRVTERVAEKGRRKGSQKRVREQCIS